jgi:hypothetical protein
MSITIPQNISIIGVYTSHSCLIVSYCANLYHDKILSNLLILLYILSVMNWRVMYAFSIIKACDIFVALTSLYYITFHSTKHFSKFYKDIWNYSLFFSCITFMINNTYFYLSNKTEIDCYVTVFSHVSVFHIYIQFIYILCIVNSCPHYQLYIKK